MGDAAGGDVAVGQPCPADLLKEIENDLAFSKGPQERAEGAQRDLEIRADVDKQATIIMAEAERDAQRLRGDGEAQAVTIFASALEEDPDFYAFQRSLEAYRVFLTENSTIVLSTDSELFEFLLGYQQDISDPAAE